MSTGKVLLGIMAGLGVGAVLGVLFAPEKGSDTRRMITKKGEELADEFKEKFEEFLDTISEKFDKVKDEVIDMADQAKGQDGEVYMDDKSTHN